MTDSLELLFDMIKIPSPSGKELAVGTFIKSHLKKHGITSEFDGTGKLNNSNTGNLIAKIEGDPKLPTILFAAHMDTVETGEKVIEPQLKNDMIVSKGNTILGADDKAAVYCLVQTLCEVHMWKHRPTIIAVFSTREENGDMGIRHLKLKEHIDYCINLESPGTLGEFVYQTLGELPFEITIHGKAAHAAMNPEKGINAIKAAALFISKLRLGKTKQGIVTNIGTISGGTANNVVPDRVIVSGQVRAFKQSDINATLEKVKALLSKICTQSGCTYTCVIDKSKGAPPGYIPKNHPIVKLAEKASRKVGVPFYPVKVTFGSDANFLSIKYPTLTFCMGGENAHSYDETISVASIKKTEILLREIITELC